MPFPSGTYTFINVKGFTVLDLSAHDQKSIIGYPLHGGANQQWIIEPTTGGFTIKNVQYGTFLRPRIGDPTQLCHDLIAMPEAFTWKIVSDGGVGNTIYINLPSSSYKVTLTNKGDPIPGTPVKICINKDQKEQVWYAVRLCDEK